MESLPWPDSAFNIVTGFSAFQFADDHAAALAEARRVSRDQVWIVVPTRLADSGIPQVFSVLPTLLPAQAQEGLKRSGMYALSAPGRLEQALAAAHLSLRSDETVEAPVVFPDAAAAVTAFLSAGATALAVRHSGQPAVEQALSNALDRFTADSGHIVLPGWFRVAQASSP